MANEEVLGPRKTMFVLVIVVGCFAVLWPRILSPLIMGPSREQLKPNQFDREAGCCEVLFEKDMAFLELINEVCSSVTHTDKLSPYSAAECRKTVNDTCGVDIAAFLKRSDNVGKTSKMLIETMRNSNSSCLREHFGVPIISFEPHLIQNSWTKQDTLKQERPPIRGAGPHPALRERGRAILPRVPAPPAREPVAMPPHTRVRSSPLSVYFELDIKPPPIPGMRPPLGSPGGPVATPKSSMGFVMPIYTICIIVFFVYTLSKILFKRTGTSTYETMSPDPQFRRRVFRDDSRTSPDKLVVTAISGLVAEVQQQMEASYAQNQQRQDVQQDNNTRPYTNGTILHNQGPVHIVASEYQESKKSTKDQEPEASPAPDIVEEANEIAEVKEIKEEVNEIEEEVKEIAEGKEIEEEVKEIKEEAKEIEEEGKEIEKDIETELVESELVKEEVLETETQKLVETADINKDSLETEIEDALETKLSEDIQTERNEDIDLETIDGELKDAAQETVEIVKESSPELVIEKEPSPESEEIKDSTPEPKELTPDIEVEEEEELIEEEDEELEAIQSNEDPEVIELDHANELIKELNDVKAATKDVREAEEILVEESSAVLEEKKEKQSTPELLEDAIKDDEDEELEEEEDNDKSSVKHEAESVKSIFLETEIPQQSRVLVADFAENPDKPQPTRHSPMVVSGKMTLSLIQDAPRETPERDQESTIDDFTTASALTQNVAEEEVEESDEEEEIEIEEIEEEIEEEEEEEPEPQKRKEPSNKTQ